MLSTEPVPDLIDSTENWERDLRKTFVPMECDIPSGGPFQGEVHSTVLPEFSISEVRSSPHRVMRGLRHIQQSAPPLYYCNLQLAGVTTIRQAQSERTANPGDVVGLDTQHPYEIESTEPFKLLCFAIPKPVLQPHLSTVELPLGAFAVGSSGLADALRAIACPFRNNTLSHAYGDYRLSGAILRLLALAFDNCVERQVVQSRAHRDDFQSIVAFINRNVCDPELRIKNVSEKFRMSERYIHKIFLAHGETFHNYVLCQRIYRCRDDIAAFGGHTANIARIAYQWGFNDLSTFYRAFKRIVGCSPGDLRQRYAGALND